MLKQKAKKLTPEQQMLGAVLSILMKKAQVVMEIKAENEIMVDRILDVIREEKGYSDQDEPVEENEPEQKPEKTAEETIPQEPIVETVEAVEVANEEPDISAVLEVAEDNQ